MEVERKEKNLHFLKISAQIRALMCLTRFFIRLRPVRSLKNTVKQ